MNQNYTFWFTYHSPASSRFFCNEFCISQILAGGIYINLNSTITGSVNLNTDGHSPPPDSEYL
jgi:hypothetical protein